MKIHDIRQGTPEWHAFRAEHYGASEAAAMLGLSSHTTRSELLRQKHTGIGKVHSEWVQEHVLDEGHRVEAAIRPHMETVLDGDLYPVLCSIEGTKISASCDGLRLEGDIAWENKQWNDALAEQVVAGTVPDEHMPQCQQILMVTGAKILVFSVSDGTPKGTVFADVKPDPAWFDRIRRGWEQFERDLAEYTPPATTVPVVATPVEALPAVSVRVDGALMVTGNLPAFGVALKAFIERIPKQPSTDQEFADAEAACKALKRAEEALEAAKNSALGSMDSVEAMLRMVEDFRAIARSSRLVAEKAVQHRKDQLREDECRRGLKAVQVAVESANRDLGGTFIVGAGRQVFADAIKGLKTMESLRNAVDTAVAREKIVINQAAERVCGNLATIDKAGLPALFADRATLVHKDPEAVAAIVSQRVAEHRAAEDRRLEADRERIRAEERARAEADAAITRAATATPAAAQAAPVAAEQAQAVVEAPEGPTDAPTLKLGQINDRLGFTVTEAFLASIGVPCAGHDKRAVLFRESQWQVIKAKLIERIRGLA